MKKNTNQQQPGDKKKNKEAATSSVDRKNNTVSKGSATATDRVKSRAGDGLANEGTITSYEGDR